MAENLLFSENIPINEKTSNDNIDDDEIIKLVEDLCIKWNQSDIVKNKALKYIQKRNRIIINNKYIGDCTIASIAIWKAYRKLSRLKLKDVIEIGGINKYEMRKLSECLFKPSNE